MEQTHTKLNNPCLSWLHSGYQQNRRRMFVLFVQRLGPVLLLGLGALLLTFLGLLGFPQPLLAAGPHYVAPDGVDSPNCLVSAPCRTLQQAVSNAASGDEIRVAAGFYTGTLTLNKNLTLRGGFTTTNWLTPNPAQNVTTINAQGIGRVIYVPGAVVVTISGFHISGGNAAEGGGVYNQSGALTLIDSQIHDNTTTGNGGGIYNQAALTLRNSQIYSNTANNGAGLAIVNAGATTLEANKIFSNTAQFGGGVYVDNSPANIKSNLIYNNSALDLGGGGLFVQSGNVSLENNTIYGNSAAGLLPQGGGLYLFNGTVGLTNSLIVANTAANGAGIYLAGSASFTVGFNDFFGNTTNHIENGSGPIDPTTLGVNNRISDPLLVNPPTDFHLSSPASPALDSGTGASTAAIDFEGQGRPFGPGMDRGADEATDLSGACFARVANGQVYTDVQAAVDAASPGGTVQVAGNCTGVQTRTGLAQMVYLSKSLTLQGGYTVTDWINPRYGPTILNANTLGRVVYVTGTASITLDGLHLTGGSVNGHGAGVFLGGNGTATLQNNAIYGNTATGANGGGVYNTGGPALLQYNTIYNNSASLGGGVYANSAGGQVALRSNAIINNNAGAGGGVASLGSGVLLAYNDAFGNTPDQYNGPFSVDATNISIAPTFVNPGGSPPDFHLQPSSALINAADPVSHPSADFDGDSRPQGARADIGADESGYFAEVLLSDAPPVAVTDTNLIRGTFITFNHTITNTGNNPTLSDTFDLTIFNSNGWPVSGLPASVTLPSGSSQSFSVVISVPTSIGSSVNNRTTITATSRSIPTIFDTTTDLIVSPGLEFTPNYTVNADPTEVLTFTHILTNTGNSTDTINLTFNSPFGWGQSVTPTQVTLGPGLSQTILARTQVVTSAAAGTVEVMTVRATSAGFGFSALVTDTVTANAVTGNRYVRPGGANINNNCTDPLLPCATVSYAINQAAFGDTIFVAQGTYNEPSGLFINQKINLRGGFSSDFSSQAADPTLTIIDAQNSERGLRIQTPASLSPRVEYFTIRNGFSSGIGGGVYLQGSSAPELVGLNIVNSAASRGGGIYIDTGAPSLLNITITGASASDRGGGIYINNSSNLTLAGLTITGATAARGGGLYLAGGSVVLTGSTIANSRANTDAGGGIYQQAGALTVQKTTLSTNTAAAQGGGLYQAGGTLVISQTRLSGNSAGGGGGIFASGSFNSTIWNSFIFSNTASSSGGGGLSKTGGALSLVNNTFYNNRATTSGGGIFASSASLVLSNTIVATNTALTSGGGLFSSGGSASLAYNNFFGNSAPASAASNIGTGSSSISADPRFLDPAAGDLHLSLASPSVDAAAPDTFLRADLEGDFRPLNQGFDMGADEVGGCLIRNAATGVIYGILQEAVDAASSGDTLQIAGICRGVRPRLVGSQTISQTAFVNKNLTLAGGYDTNFTFINDPNTTLDALGAGRVVVITNAASVSISKLNLTNGNAAGLGGHAVGGDAGGGIYNANGALTVSGSVITGNQASYGGGLYHLAGTLTLGSSDPVQQTQILSNTATFGGGVYLQGGPSALNNVTFNGNTASQDGGGLYNGSTAILTQTIFFSNTASTGSGGGVYNTGSLQGDKNLTVAYNTAAGSGGGFYNAATGQLLLQRSIVLSNTALSGGGLYNTATGLFTMTNTLVALNRASGGAGDGGGLYNLSAGLTLRHDTFYANSAGRQGGGIFHNAAGGLINSTLIVSNTAASGGSAMQNSGAAPTFDYNDVFNNAINGFTPNGPNLNLAPDFISTDPATGSFLRLAGGSPVEDQADPASPILVDIDNDPRPSGLNFDIGADEVGGCFVRINGNPPTYGNIQLAVNLSSPGDEIRVAGICSGVRPALDGGATVSQTVFLTKSLTLRGGYTNANDLAGPPDPAANPTILDALNQGRVVYITHTAHITIDGLQLRQGQAVNGGAMFVGSGLLTMTTSSVYSGTAANNGGGIYYQGSAGLLSGVQVYSNTAASGGGLYNAGAGLVITGATSISRNIATLNGGGIYNNSDALRLGLSEIGLNQAQNGGGLYNNTGQMTLEGNQIHHNTASANGGGFFNNNSAATLDRGNRFYNNHANGDGGAIYHNNGSLTLWNTFIYQNTTGDQGAGFYNANGSPNILHNTFYQNTAVNQGGAIYIAGGNPSIRNNIFDGNSAPGGSAIGSAGGGSLSFNDYSPADAASQVSGVNNGVGSNNTNSNPPGFANPAGGDFHLQATSPVINQAETPGVVSYDFEDDPRPINSGSDMGADEYSACLARVESSGIIYGRIQTALNNALADDTIKVAAGTCQEGVTISKNITIIGSWLPDFSAQVSNLVVPVTIINAAGTGNRVVTVTNAVTGSANLAWVELRGGSTTGNGGGILSQAPRLELSNLRVVTNMAANGGGIYISSGQSANLQEVIIDNNQATANGGGLYNGPNSTVNSLNGGITRNTAGGNGGGIYNDTGSIVAVEGGLPIGGDGFQPSFGNQAQNGGGIFNNGATFTLFNKQINNNIATTGNGGGVYITGSSAVTLTNPGFYHNRAQSNGGGLYRSAAGFTALYHATMNSNDALTGQGGGVYNTGSSMVISASIVAFNTSSSGGSGIHGAANVDVAYTMRESSNTYAGVILGTGNIDGGAPFIREPGGDLLFNSPAIDAVPTTASHVLVDRFVEARPQLCAKDMGRDEFLVGARTIPWSNPTPASAVLTPTASVTYTFILTNNSENWSNGFSLGPATGYTETLTLTLNSSQNWGQIVSLSGGVNPTVLSDTLAGVTLGPGQMTLVTVKVTVPPGTLADKVDSTSLTYQAVQCPDGPVAAAASPAAITSVESSLNFIIGPDNFGAALPGQTLTYTHILTNLGNITDTYTLAPGPGLYASAVISEPASGLITLGPGQTATVVISVTINPEAAGGLPIPDTTSAIAISGINPALQKAAANNTVISYTTGTRYVSLAGTDSIADETELTGLDYPDNNCTQPDVGACRTIQQALNQAAPGDLIKIDQGVYNVVGTDILTRSHLGQTLTQIAFINKSVTLQGGFNRDNWGQNPPNHISQTTTLDPQGLGRAVYITATAAVTLDRLNLANGAAAGLGGGPGDVDAGGNIYNENGDLTLTANRLYNGAAAFGGGLFSGGGNLLLQNNFIHGNTAGGQGGAVYADNGVSTLQNNTFYNNSAGQEGGAVYQESGVLEVSNTIIASNSSGSPGAVFAGSSATMDYNLFDSNTNDDVGGAASASPPNDVFDAPRFVNPGLTPPDLHLQSTSPARDTGDPATTLTIDYDNDARPLPAGGAFDIGADERVPVAGVFFEPDTITTTLAGSTVVQTHTLQNTGDVTDTFSLTVSNSQPGWGISFDPPLPANITLGSNVSQTITATYVVPLDANGQSNVTVITATSSATDVFDAVTDVITVSSAAWQIGKSVTPTPTIQPGDRLTYTLFITNSGDLDAGGVYTITDPLPNDTSFVSASPAPNATSPAVQWVSSTPVASNGGAISFTFVVSVTKPLTDGTAIVNQNYSVTGGGAFTQVTGAPVTVTVDAPASLSAAKTASAALVQPGDFLTYTITLTNDSAALGPALNAVISDTLPANTVFQSMGFVPPASGIVTGTANPVLWQLTSPISVGGSAQVTLTVRVTSPLAAPALLTNTFEVTANIPTALSGSLTTPVTATNSISLSKSVVPTTTLPGGVVTYTITLSNSGNGFAAVNLTDTLDPAFTPPSVITNVVVPGRTWDTTEGTATVSFTATAPAALGTYANPLITAAYDLTQTTLTDSAPLTVTTPQVDFSSAAYSVTENGGLAAITVTLSAASSLTATVNYATGDGSASAGSDYTTSTGTITFTPGITRQTFSVPILDDSIFEGSETVTLTLSSPTNATLAGPNNPATLTIVEDEAAPVVDFSSAAYSVAENGGPATITVTLSAAAAVTATVNYAASDGSALVGSDYVTTTGTLTFTPGVTSQTFSVPVINDTLFESAETVIITLSGPVNASAAGPNNPATLTIVEDETTPPTVQFSSAAYSANENDGSALITVTLSSVSGVTATVNYATGDNTAAAGSDYTAVAGTLTFPPGVVTQTFAVPILNDAIFEGSEALTLSLTGPVSATLGLPTPASLTIVDDENAPSVDFSSAGYSVPENAGPALITVTLSRASAVTTTVNFSSSAGTASAGSDYSAVSGILTFTPGVTLQTFTVPITNDSALELDETVNLSLSGAANATLGLDSAVLTILNDDATPEVDFSAAAYSVDEGIGTAAITVTLSGPSALTATVDYASSDGTASAGSDYVAASGTLTFTPGVTLQTFTVPITDDLLYESSETLSLTLSGPANANLGPNTPATLTIIDNDTPVADFSAAAYSVNENGGPALITVTLSVTPTAPGSIDYHSNDLTATAGSDYGAVNSTLNLTPGVTVYTFTVPITDDASFENDETLHLTLSNPINAALGTANNPATLTIVDDENAPTVDFSSASYSVAENGGPALITVTLSGASVVTSSVNFATANNTATAGSDYLARTGTLTFTPGVTLQTFSLPITDDAVFEGNETLTLTLSGATNAALGSANNPATLTIVEDEVTPAVAFSVSAYSVAENAGPAAITVTLSGATALTTTVDFSTSDGTSLAGSDYLTAAGTLTFTPGITVQTFSVSILNDATQEVNESLNLSLLNPANAVIGATNPATLTIVDDDAPAVDFSSAAYSVNEDAGAATITVTLSSTPGLTVNVNYATIAGGTALAGSDYLTVTGALTFAPGVISQTFTVPITDDSLFENSETVILALSGATNASLGSANNPATLTIVDNDAAPLVNFSSPTYSVNEGAGAATITVTLSAASGVTATVNYATIQNTAQAGLDFLGAGGALTFAPGVTRTTFSVTILNDALFENSETLTLTLSSPVSATIGATNPATLTIVDNDAAPLVNFSSPTYSVAENAGSATITVTLSAASGVTATVNYATSNGSALAGSDYTATAGALTFTPGITLQTFSVPILDDALLEGSETVSLSLSSPVSATIGATNPATLTIVDNDTPTVDFSSSSYNVDEGAGSAPITVTLSFASAVTATVNYASSDGSASTGSDYIAASGTLTFTPGVTLQTFSVPILDDSLVEANETLTLTLSSPNNALPGSLNNPAVLTILNNDQRLIYLPILTKNFTQPQPPQLPDLVVTDISLTPNANGSYRVQVTALNQSATPVTFGNNFYVNLYLDGNFSTPAIVWGVQASWFGAWQSRILTADYTFTPGTHSLHAWADAFNTVVELNEANNILTRSGVVFAALPEGVAPQDSSTAPSGPLPTPTVTP